MSDANHDEVTKGETPSGILEELLATLEQGTRVVELERFQERYPGKEEEVRRLYEAARIYLESKGMLTSGGPTRPRIKDGTRLGDFVVEGFLAEGGMGAVYHARQLSLDGRSVALKVQASEFQTETNKARFRREASLIAELHHPNLSEVYGFGEERGALFIAMRLVRGKTLAQMLALGAGHRPSSRAIVGWMTQIADGLRVLHENGLVHRDVKPSNIIIEPSAGGETAVLVDFGLVRRVEKGTVTRTGSIAATPSYAAPEQIWGESVDARADVFSLGATMYDLLVWQPPHGNTKARRRLEGLPDLIRESDRDMAAIVARATEPEKEARYPDAGALLIDLKAWLGGEEVSARAWSRRKKIRKWVGRRYIRILRFSALGVAFLVCVLFLFGAGQGVAEVRAIESAWDESDLLELTHLSERLPEWALFLLGPRHESDVRRLRDLKQPDPLVGIVRSLNLENPSSALLVAATSMRMDGLASDLLIREFFLRALRRYRPEEHGESGTGPVAIRLVARLFYERPDTTTIESEQSQPFLTEIRRLFANEHLPENERLFLLTAISGGGTNQDMEMIASWLDTPDLGLEGVRLGLNCLRRLMLRSIHSGTSRDVDFESIHRSLFPLKGLFEEPGDVTPVQLLHAHDAMVDLIGGIARAWDDAHPEARPGFLSDSPEWSAHWVPARHTILQFLDADTVMGAPASTGSWNDLVVGFAESKPDEADARIASWDLTPEKPELSGEASGLSILDCDHKKVDRNPRFLRLWAFGRSTVRLRFRLDEEHAGRDATLRLFHLTGARPYYPFAGEAYLEIRIGGRMLYEALRVSATEKKGPRWASIQVPGELLSSGENTISIRSGPLSTSTYRLMRVDLQMP